MQDGTATALRCAECGESFVGKCTRPKFCSRACGDTWWSREYAERRVATRRKAALPSCGECGAAFEPKRKSSSVRQFCSRPCCQAYWNREHSIRRGVPREPTACPQCAQPMPPCKVRRHPRTVCSKRCAQQYRVAKAKAAAGETLPQQFMCRLCGAAFSRPRKPGARPLYCSQPCKDRAGHPESYAKSPTPRECPGCGVTFTPSEGQRSDRVFCGVKCGRARENRRERVLTTREGTISRLRVFARDGWRCGLCRMRIDAALSWPHPLSASLDHVVPLAMGGSHTEANLQATHLTCNRHKHVKTDYVGGIII